MKNDGFALITGASRGLGMAFARALAQRHCNLVLVARSPEPIHAFANELRRAHPVSVVAIQVDLSTAGAGQILAEQLSSGGIPIELLVNKCGLWPSTRIPRQFPAPAVGDAPLKQPGHRRAYLQPPSGNARARAKRDHQHLLDCRVPAHSICERLLCCQGVPDDVFTGAGGLYLTLQSATTVTHSVRLSLTRAITGTPEVIVTSRKSTCPAK